MEKIFKLFIIAVLLFFVTVKLSAGIRGGFSKSLRYVKSTQETLTSSSKDYKSKSVSIRISYGKLCKSFPVIN